MGSIVGHGPINSQDSVVEGGWMKKSVTLKRGPKDKSFSLLKFKNPTNGSKVSLILLCLSLGSKIQGTPSYWRGQIIKDQLLHK